MLDRFASRETGAAGEVTMTDKKALAGKRVLVVEDDFFLADTVVRGLEESGVEVVGPVGDIDDALELIDETDHLDAVVLDLNLKGDLSYPVAELLFQRKIPFVVCTGYNTTDMPLAVRTALALSKPVESKRLTAAVAKCMGPVGRMETARSDNLNG